MMQKILLSMIAAVATNRVIGANNDMPWHLSTDLKRFKALTIGKPVIMGRRTFQSVGKALPLRLNIVVSRDPSLVLEGAVIAPSLDAAIKTAHAAAVASGANEIMITGGGQIYAEAMARADRLYITHVVGEPAGDTVFPVIDAASWEIVEEQSVARGEKDSADTLYRVYQRIKA